MESNTFKIIVVGIGSAILTSLIFVSILLLNSNNKMNSTATNIPTISEVSPAVEVEEIASTSISVNTPALHQETSAQPVDTLTTKSYEPPVAQTNQKPQETTSPSNQIQVTESTVITPAEINSAPTYDYTSMLSFHNTIQDFLADDMRAKEAFTSSQKAGVGKDYKLAIKYAEESIAIYDDLIEKNSDLDVPKNMPADVDAVMRDIKQIYREHLYNYREIGMIHLSFMEALDEDGLPSQAESDSYKKAQELQKEAYTYAQEVFLPKLNELTDAIDSYKE